MSGKKKAPKLKVVKSKPAPVVIENKPVRDILFEDVKKALDEAAQTARDFGMTYGQWQDTLGEIQNECATRARDSGDYKKVI
jgi:hypothetical protein